MRRSQALKATNKHYEMVRREPEILRDDPDHDDDDDDRHASARVIECDMAHTSSHQVDSLLIVVYWIILSSL